MAGRPPKFKMKKTLLLFLFTVTVTVFSPVTAVRGAAISPENNSASLLSSISGASNAPASIPETVLFHPDSCRQSQEGQGRGASLCEHAFADESKLTAESRYETAWNEFKEQTILTLHGPNDEVKARRTIRHKVDYATNRQKKRIKESFDILSSPQGEKTTREFVVLEYRDDGKDVRRVYYTKYEQIGESAEAALVYYTVLSYDGSGEPLKGRAESWKDGKKSLELFRWDKRMHGESAFDPQLWQQWESLAARAIQMQNLIA